MAQIIAIIFLLAMVLGVVKMVFDVQKAKLEKILKHLLK